MGSGEVSGHIGSYTYSLWMEARKRFIPAHGCLTFCKRQFKHYKSLHIEYGFPFLVWTKGFGSLKQKIGYLYTHYVYVYICMTPKFVTRHSCCLFGVVVVTTNNIYQETYDVSHLQNQKKRAKTKSSYKQEKTWLWTASVATTIRGCHIC